MLFRDRHDAGQRLGEELMAFADVSSVILALPRGGVPVGFEVARMLRAPLDVFVVRKLGLPGHKEFAMGAIASGGIRVLNRQVIENMGIAPALIDSVAMEEARELERREHAYRGVREPVNVRDRTVILVDDGAATGATMRAAVAALRQKEPRKIVVAVPVAARSACRELEAEADEAICLYTPFEFFAVGQWYQDFSEVTDEEVRELLERGATSSSGPRAPVGGASDEQRFKETG